MSMAEKPNEYVSSSSSASSPSCESSFTALSSGVPTFFLHPDKAKMHTSIKANTPNILFFIIIVFLLMHCFTRTGTFYNIFTVLATLFISPCFLQVPLVQLKYYYAKESTTMDEYMTVELTLDNDEVVECAILTLFEAGGKEYIALLPLNEDGETEDGDVYLYRYTEDADGEPELENIEDDDEYEIAADAFDEWMDTQEFEESGDDE